MKWLLVSSVCETKDDHVAAFGKQRTSYQSRCRNIECQVSVPPFEVPLREGIANLYFDLM